MTVPLHYYIVLSMVLFSLGIAGVTTRRNPILIFMSIELMLNAVNLSLIAFGRYLGDAGGQMLTIFVMAVAAAEVSVGLGILIAIFRTKDNVDVDVLNGLKG
ncbi:MAG: NADH-quinone oxidoreductase subunit NuoK [Armatimonadaceae bacterium]|jgi:NADH-quinone oxidoreductase subunit K